MPAGVLKMPKVESNQKSYRDVLQDNESLAVFLRSLAEFDAEFTKRMFDGKDFTIRLEVRGNKNELLHARVYAEAIDRPAGVDKRLAKKDQE